MKFSVFIAEKVPCLLHGQVFIMFNLCHYKNAIEEYDGTKWIVCQTTDEED